MRNFLIAIFLIMLASFSMALAPTVTVVHPNGGETFDKLTVSTVDINFNVIDPDSNSLLIDLNFSTSNTQGTGTVIINDVNTDSATITCADSDFSNTTLCTFSWDISGVANATYFILSNASDGNVLTDDFDASDSSFTIITTVLPTAVTIDLDNIGEIVNNSTRIGAEIVGGIADQGDIIGLGIGLAIAFGFIASAILAVFGIVFVIFNFAKKLKKQT